jgi:hypothetical protein
MLEPTHSANSQLSEPEKEEKQQPVPTNEKTDRQEEDALDVVLLATTGNRKELFDLEIARRREAKRRLMVIGDYAQSEFDKKQLRRFALARYLSEKVLINPMCNLKC